MQTFAQAGFSEIDILLWAALFLIALIIGAILWVMGQLRKALDDSVRTRTATERMVALLESIDKKLGQ